MGVEDLVGQVGRRTPQVGRELALDLDVLDGHPERRRDRVDRLGVGGLGGADADVVVIDGP